MKPVVLQPQQKLTKSSNLSNYHFSTVKSMKKPKWFIFSVARVDGFTTEIILFFLGYLSQEQQATRALPKLFLESENNTNKWEWGQLLNSFSPLTTLTFFSPLLLFPPSTFKLKWLYKANITFRTPLINYVVSLWSIHVIFP